MLERQQPHARAFIARAARQSPDGFRRTGDHATEGQRLDGSAQVPGRDVHQAGFFFAATFLTAFLVAFFAAFLTGFFTAPAAAFGLAAVLVIALFAAPFRPPFFGATAPASPSYSPHSAPERL